MTYAEEIMPVVATLVQQDKIREVDRDGIA